MFSNTTIFITGASTGLGRATAIALARAGARLALMARDTHALTTTAEACIRVGASPLICPGDVTSFSDCQRAIDNCAQHFGKLDHLVLNAGISMWARFDSLPDTNLLHQLMATNYFGAIHCTHAALPYLKQSHGLITVISSLQGMIGVPFHSGYAASKHALHGFFDSLRIELAKSIDILIVSPSWIRDTQLKQNALISDAPPSAHVTSRHSASSLALDQCVNALLRAMHKRKRTLVLPTQYRWLPLLKLLMPAWLDRRIAKKVS